MPNGVRFVFACGDGRINAPKPEYGKSFYEADTAEELAGILRDFGLTPAYQGGLGFPPGQDWADYRGQMAYGHLWQRQVLQGIAYKVDSDFRQLWRGWIYTEPVAGVSNVGPLQTREETE